MAQCEVCGNDYVKPLTIEQDGERHVFDSFECAIEKMAPRCAHCGVRVVGHGASANGQVFCCDGCAQKGASPRGG